VAAACGPSRPGLQCYRQGGLDCLASSRARWGRSLVGQLFRGLNFGDDDDLRLLLLSNNYNQAATDQTTKRTKLTKYCTKIGLAILARLTTAAPVSPSPRFRNALVAVASWAGADQSLEALSTTSSTRKLTLRLTFNRMQYINRR
jgi:hypothetical protein